MEGSPYKFSWQQERFKDTAYHRASLIFGFGRSRYFVADRAACVSAKNGALSPIRAYSSREIPSGFFAVDTARRGGSC
jgi:hypothetical protein